MPDVPDVRDEGPVLPGPAALPSLTVEEDAGVDEGSDAMMGNGYGGAGWMHDGMGWGGWLMMTFVVLVGVALIGTVVYLLVRRPRNAPLGHQTGAPVLSSAEATLDERFARGEIDEDDYQLRRAALRANA